MQIARFGKTVAAIASLVSACSGAAFAATYTIEDLGVMRTKGGSGKAGKLLLKNKKSKSDITQIQADGLTYINDSGQMAGTLDVPDSSYLFHAFVYNKEQVTDIGAINNSFNNSAKLSFSTGINNAGQVIGYNMYSDYDNAYSFIYKDGTMSSVGAIGTVASAINNMGQGTGFLYLEGFFPYPQFYHAFLYADGVVTDIGTLGDYTSESHGTGINDLGQIVGLSDTLDGNCHAFLYSQQTMTDLGTLGGANSIAADINLAGQVTGFSEISGSLSRHAFIFSAGTMTDLGTLGGSDSEGNAINNAGQIVGWSETADGTVHAFLYSEGKMIDLNSLLPIASGWEKVSYAYDINNRGEIIGSGYIGGIEHSFKMTAK